MQEKYIRFALAIGAAKRAAHRSIFWGPVPSQPLVLGALLSACLDGVTGVCGSACTEQRRRLLNLRSQPSKGLATTCQKIPTWSAFFTCFAVHSHVVVRFNSSFATCDDVELLTLSASTMQSESSLNFEAAACDKKKFRPHRNCSQT